MKILQIKINNLASLEGESIIDFTREPLASAGIFAITGPTGAGKSTILDGLCLALYARTPRYVQAGTSRGIELQDSSGETIHQGDPRAILRDGTAEGSASVTFMGIDNDLYEATWSVRRARLKVTGKLTPYSHSLYNKTRQKPVPGTKTAIQKEIERLVGLSFEQFTRSVLLAQGDFTAFMKAGKEEKSALLEKLTGSQIYSEISKNIYEHYKNEEEALKNLRVKADVIDLLTEQQQQLIEDEISAYQQEANKLLQQKTVIDTAVGWHRQKADLEAKKNEAFQLHETAVLKATALAAISTQLAQIMQARPLKTVRETLLEEQAVAEDLSQKKEALEQKLQDSTQAQARAVLAHQTAQAQKRAQENTFREARPLLLQASTLDTKIDYAKRQVQLVNTSLRQSLEAKDELIKEQEAIQKRSAIQQGALKAIEDWIRQHGDRSSIADSTELIVSRLEQAAALLKDRSIHEGKVAPLSQQKAAQDKQLASIHQQITATDKRYQENLRLQQQAQQQLKQADTDHLDEELTESQHQQRTLEQAKNQFDHFDRSRKDYEDAHEREQEIRQRIEALTALAARLKPEMLTIETQVRTTRELVEKAALRNAANIEQLRANLKPDDPCPVCGSTAHPYTEGAHADLGTQVIDTLKEDLNATENAYKTIQQQYTQTDSENRLRQQEQENLHKDAENKYTIYKNARQQWEAAACFAILKDQSPNEIIQWFDKEIKNRKDSQEVLQKNKDAARKIMQQHEKLQQATQSERDLLQKLRDDSKDLQSELQLKSQILFTSQAAIQEIEEKLQAIQNNLNGYFPSEDWFRNWQEKPEVFIGAIRKFAEDWKKKKKEAEQLSREIDQSKIALAGFDRQLEAASKQLGQQQQAADQEQQALQELLRERSSIFEGQCVAEVEKNLQRALEQAAQEAETSRLQAEQLEKEIHRHRFEKETMESSLRTAAAKVRQLDQKINDWLNDYNTKNTTTPLDRKQVESLLDFSDQWIRQNQEKIQQAGDLVRDAKSRLEERERDLKKHLATISDTRPLETLLELQAKRATSLEALRKDLVERQLRLEIHQQNLKKLGHLLTETERQQKVFDQWAALNSLIGSKEGRKFREIAQQYTLDLLLQFANQHLRILSKRYILSRIPDSLGIQVIDQDMADEIRSVYSLSGGESFLVSLALALGLASLSSHRLKVKSLFIDEGFGTLDPATLCVAMDALERLQDQGRKVGVISHVQEMTERIAVQINVHKNASGKSDIAVTSLS